MKNLALAVALLVLTTSANGDVLFSQPLSSDPSSGYGWNSDGPDNYHGSDQQIANVFVLGAAGTVNGVDWFGSYAGNATPDPMTDFVLRFFDDGVGRPGSIFFETAVSIGATDTGFVNSAGNSIYNYSASFSGPSLVAGTTYFISVLENDTNPDSIWVWAFADDGVGESWGRLLDTGGWNSGGFQGNAFQLNEIPEPSSTALLGVCLIGAWMRRRRS